MRILTLFLAFLILTGCKKIAGEGGKASITGKIWIEEWDNNFLVKKYEYDGYDEDVFIIYGDHTSYDDKTSTNFNGQFEFKYLRKGKYKIYVFSDKKQSSSSQNKKEAIVKELEITDNKQTIDVGSITILKN